MDLPDWHALSACKFGDPPPIPLCPVFFNTTTAAFSNASSALVDFALEEARPVSSPLAFLLPLVFLLGFSAVLVPSVFGYIVSALRPLICGATTALHPVLNVVVFFSSPAVTVASFNLKWALKIGWHSLRLTLRLTRYIVYRLFLLAICTLVVAGSAAIALWVCEDRRALLDVIETGIGVFSPTPTLPVATIFSRKNSGMDVHGFEFGNMLLEHLEPFYGQRQAQTFIQLPQTQVLLAIYGALASFYEARAAPLVAFAMAWCEPYLPWTLQLRLPIMELVVVVSCVVFARLKLRKQLALGYRAAQLSVVLLAPRASPHVLPTLVFCHRKLPVFQLHLAQLLDQDLPIFQQHLAWLLDNSKPIVVAAFVVPYALVVVFNLLRLSWSVAASMKPKPRAISTLFGVSAIALSFLVPPYMSPALELGHSVLVALEEFAAFAVAHARPIAFGVIAIASVVAYYPGLVRLAARVRSCARSVPSSTIDEEIIEEIPPLPPIPPPAAVLTSRKLLSRTLVRPPNSAYWLFFDSILSITVTADSQTSFVFSKVTMVPNKRPLITLPDEVDCKELALSSRPAVVPDACGVVYLPILEFRSSGPVTPSHSGAMVAFNNRFRAGEVISYFAMLRSTHYQFRYITQSANAIEFQGDLELFAMADAFLNGFMELSYFEESSSGGHLLLLGPPEPVVELDAEPGSPTYERILPLYLVCPPKPADVVVNEREPASSSSANVDKSLLSSEDAPASNLASPPSSPFLLLAPQTPKRAPTFASDDPFDIGEIVPGLSSARTISFCLSGYDLDIDDYPLSPLFPSPASRSSARMLFPDSPTTPGKQAGESLENAFASMRTSTPRAGSSKAPGGLSSMFSPEGATPSRIFGSLGQRTVRKMNYRIPEFRPGGDGDDGSVGVDGGGEDSDVFL